MKATALLSLLAALACAPVVQAQTAPMPTVAEISIRLTDESQHTDLADRRSISQKISDKLEKARRNREQRKLIREQREREKQRQNERKAAATPT